jgi:hypothetical protein
MRRVFEAVAVTLLVLLVAGLLRVMSVSVSGQTPARAGAPPAKADQPSLKTAWGDPNLQGIWTDEYQTPLQRPAKYAGREFFTDAEIAALDKQRAAIPGRPRVRPGIGSEADVAGAYDGVWNTIKHTGRRTSLVVDPPDGRIPPYTPAVQKMRAEIRQFQLDTLQATNQCKNHERSCAGGKYAQNAPRRAEIAPYYMTGTMNRADGPEDRSLGERCLAGTLPEFANVNGFFRRIVQAPGVVSIFYDSGQGQGWQRIIPVGASPHLPQAIREWHGDSRGRWEGNTLVVDVTNFSPKQDFRGSRENLHLVERFTRADSKTLEYAVTIDDPTTWTKPWTVKQELTMQDNQANRVYVEPRCHEGNFGMVGMLAGARTVERAFAEGQGPDPATVDLFSTGPTFFNEDDIDPLAGGE